jgi:hypothetical protein
MDNSIPNNSEKYHNSFYTSLDNDQIQDIRKNYKVLDVDWLDNTLVNYVMFNDEYFTKSLKKKAVVNNMLDYYLNDKDADTYKKTDYLCN